MKLSLVILLCLSALVVAKVRKPINVWTQDGDSDEEYAREYGVVEKKTPACAWVLDRECPKTSIKYRYPFFYYPYVYCCEKNVYRPYVHWSAKG